MTLALPAVLAQWWPADVTLPVDQSAAAPDTETPGRSLRRCRVYVTSTDLVVFDAPDREVFRSPVDFPATPRPPAANTWPRPSIDIVTAAGRAVVSPTGGCGCGHPLRAWTPEWASRWAVLDPDHPWSLTR